LQLYSRNLANRLIHSASPHMDNEELMINKLKVCYVGHLFLVIKNAFGVMFTASLRL